MKGRAQLVNFFANRKHARLRGLLSPYIDEQVTPAERLRLEDHLEQCAECREELTSLRLTVSLLGELPEVRTSRSFALTAHPEPPVSRFNFTTAARIGASAAVVLLIALVVTDMTGLLTRPVGPSETTVEVIKEVEVVREVIKEVPVEKIVTKEVVKEVQVPGETIVVEKEVVKEVPVEKVVIREVVKQVEPVVIIKEVVKEVPVERVVVKEIEVIKEVIKEVPVEKVVTKEVVKEVEVAAAQPQSAQPAAPAPAPAPTVASAAAPLTVEREVVKEVPSEKVSRNRENCGADCVPRPGSD